MRSVVRDSPGESERVVNQAGPVGRREHLQGYLAVRRIAGSLAQVRLIAQE